MNDLEFESPYFIINKYCEEVVSFVGFSLEKLKKVSVEIPKEGKFGDFSTNMAMVLCKDFGMKPMDLAKILVEKLLPDNRIEKAEIAGNGFVNVFFTKDYWHRILLNMLEKDFDIIEKFKNSQVINIEYASPNPTGPIHVGHCRGAIFGDVMAKLLDKIGHKVTREFYINDAGEQIITLCKSVYLRYLEQLGNKIEIPEGLYPGEYLIPIAEEIFEKYGNGLNEEFFIDNLREELVDKMMDGIRQDLHELGVKHDIYFSEKKQLHDSGKVEEAIKFLTNQGLVYQGTLEAPKGSDEEYIAEQQWIFKSTKFGDDVDRVVKRADGKTTYFASDIAYALSKFERGSRKNFIILGHDHAGYVTRLKSAGVAITNGGVEIEVILCQMVKLLKNGEIFKMSKRAGNFITAKDLIDEIGADAIRFMMLSVKNDSHLDLDIEIVKRQSRENPIFYVQYAHARCCSIIRNAKEIGIEMSSEAIHRLLAPAEIELIKKIYSFKKTLEIASQKYEPHRIVFYLIEIAGLLHNFWNLGNSDESLRIINKSNLELTKARITMIYSIAQIIKNALEILGIRALEEMR